MSGTAAELVCKTTVGGTWVVCPVCRRGKLLKLTESTRAQGLVLFCRCCKHETVVEIGPGGGGLPRVWAAAGEEQQACLSHWPGRAAEPGHGTGNFTGEAAFSVG